MPGVVFNFLQSRLIYFVFILLIDSLQTRHQTGQCLLLHMKGISLS